METKLLRAFFWPAACMALLVMLSMQGSAPTVAAQAGGAAKPPEAAAKPPDQDATKKDTEEESPFTFRSGVTLITTPVTVFDSGKQFVYDIDPNEFKVYDNGQPQKIYQVGMELYPVNLVVVVETNNLTDPFLPDVRTLGSMFSDMLMGPQGSVALVTYSDHVEVPVPFTSNGDTLDTALRKLMGRGGGMHLNDAMARAFSMLDKQPKDNRRVVLVFSDGHNIGSQTSHSELVKRAMNENISVYGLGFSPAKGLWKRPVQDPRPDLATQAGAMPMGPGEIATPTNIQSRYEAPVPIAPIMLDVGEELKSIIFKDSLEFFCAYSGGVYYQKWGKSDLQDALGRISTEIHGQYELAYYPDNLADTGYHKIKVEVRRPGAKVRARLGYFYQATPR
jgi:VWFA-related protein